MSGYTPAIRAWVENSVGRRWGDLFHRSRRTDPDAFLARQLEHCGPLIQTLREDAERGFRARLAELQGGER